MQVKVMSGPLPVNDTVDMAIREIIREYVFLLSHPPPVRAHSIVNFVMNVSVCLSVGFYNKSKGLFFDLDDGGRRGHEKKLFKRRFRLYTMKCLFSNRVVDNWNSLSAQCVRSCTINTFKKHFSVHSEPESNYNS